MKNYEYFAMPKLSDLGKQFNRIIIFPSLLILIASGCGTTRSSYNDISATKTLAAKAKTRTLSAVLRKYFRENNIYIDEEKSKNKCNIGKLWNALGIKREEISYKTDGGTKIAFLFDADKLKAPSLRYKTYQSHLATGTQDEFVILELNVFNSDYQLLLFKKQGQGWVYITHEIIHDNGGYGLDLEFLRTDNTLLFSVIETFAHGDGEFSNSYVIHRLIDGKLKIVIDTLKSGYQENEPAFFKKEFEAQMWPFFFSSPNIGFTYYITYQGDSFYYDSKFKDVPRFFILFTMEKRVLFNWDPKTSQYVLDKKNSQLDKEEIRAIFDDGPEEFYKKNKTRIDSFKFSGTERQKEWAQLFKKVAIGKTELK